MSKKQTTSPIRRALAGVAAAATIAVSGLSFITPQDAQAAGVKQTYVIQTSASDLSVQTASPQPKKR